MSDLSLQHHLTHPQRCTKLLVSLSQRYARPVIDRETLSTPPRSRYSECCGLRRWRWQRCARPAAPLRLRAGKPAAAATRFGACPASPADGEAGHAARCRPAGCAVTGVGAGGVPRRTS